MKSKYKTLWWLWSSFSVLSVIKVLYYQLLKSVGMLNYNKTFKVAFKHNGEWLQFILRYNNDDFAILRGTFMSKVYDVDVGEVKTIIDAGSHIGCVAVYYAKKYPDAEIFCFEPNMNSRLICSTNGDLNNVTLNISGNGISDKIKKVGFNSNSKNPSFSFIGGKGKQIYVTTLDSIIELYGLKQVDILKLDIEGHEPQAFAGMQESKEKIKHILLENHSAYYSLSKIKKIIKDNGYTILPELPIWEKLYGEKNTMFLLK